MEDYSRSGWDPYPSKHCTETYTNTIYQRLLDGGDPLLTDWCQPCKWGVYQQCGGRCGKLERTERAP